jgi:uncharacterized DUF497 family protein
MADFDWDEHNVGHISRHSVTPLEVEELFSRPNIVLQGSTVKGETRFKAYGTTARNRELVVIFTFRAQFKRPVTAYPMNRTDRRTYVEQLKELEGE